MKKLIRLFAVVIGMSFYFTGCYTIVWDPREEYPETESSYDSNSEFYGTDYYGGYLDYYGTPWWVGVPVYLTYPGETDNSQTKNRNNGRNSDTESIRNSNGRGNTDRNSGITNNNPPPTTTTNSGYSNIINTPPPTRDSNSGSSNNINSSTSTSNTRSSGSNETRNSSGSRNSGSGRR